MLVPAVSPVDPVVGTPLVDVAVDFTKETATATITDETGTTLRLEATVTIEPFQGISTTTILTAFTPSNWDAFVEPDEIVTNNPTSRTVTVELRVPKGIADGHNETLTVHASSQVTVLNPSNNPTVDTDTAEISVKNTSPKSKWEVRITDPDPDEVFKTDGLTINGTASYNLGTISRVEVKVCTGPWTVATGTTEWTIEYDCSNLDDGEHTIYARARSGDELSPTTEIKVIQQRTDPASPGEPQNPGNGNVDDGRDYTMIALVIVIVLVVIGVAYYIHRRRQRADTQYYAAFA
jgi:heme/copper-type cytochrome/quinol oxidase subunit 2